MTDARWSKMWKWGLCILLLLAAISAEAAEVPLEVYGNLPSIENVAISPDGTLIAYVKRQKKERIVCVLSLTERKIIRTCRLSDAKLRDIMWADNKHVLLVVSITSAPPRGLVGRKSEVFFLKSYDIGSGEIKNPLNGQATSRDSILNIIISMPSIRRIGRQTLVFVAGFTVKGHTIPVLFKLNLTTGRSKIVARGDDHSCGWLVDENGVVVAAESYNDHSQEWELVIRKKKRLSKAASGKADIEFPTPVGFSPAGDAIWMETVDNSDPVWEPVSLKSAEMGKPLQETKEFRELVTDPYTDRVVGGYRLSGDVDFVFFDPLQQLAWEAVENRFPEERVRIVSASSDYKKMVILADGPVHGYAYYLVDTASTGLSRIGKVYDGLTKLAEVRHIEYAASDGLKIPAYLTLPMDREAKKLPLVVMPHGGPAEHDTGLFDWWAQALASRGYAVLQPNYRGSDLNWKLMSAGFGQWGRKMQTDLSDGVRYLVGKGTVDPDRVCIVGVSYGGYAALAGATIDTGVYRCAISVGGISDLRKFRKWVGDKANRFNEEGTRYWDRYFSASGADDPIFRTLSPLEYAEKVSIPVMLIHGRDDTVVPFNQSKMMAEALKDANKSVELVTLDGEDHWLSKSETRLQMLQATVRFLKTYNPSD